MGWIKLTPKEFEELLRRTDEQVKNGQRSKLSRIAEDIKNAPKPRRVKKMR